MRRAHHFLTLTICALMAGALPSTASANGYGYSVLRVIDLAFTGASVFDHQSSDLENGATFPPLGTQTWHDPLDPLQARVGVGPFPPEAFYTTWGEQRGQNYARSDSHLTSASILGMSGVNVAEANRSAPGAAGSGASTSLSFGLVQAGSGPVTFSFRVVPLMFLYTRSVGDEAGAELRFTLTLFEHGTTNPLFVWKPTGDPLEDIFTSSPVSVSNISDPASLNTRIRAVDVGYAEYDSLGGQFSVDINARAGYAFDVELEWQALVAVSVAPAVPEPSRSALFMLGVLSVLGWGHRRRRLSIAG